MDERKRFMGWLSRQVAAVAGVAVVWGWILACGGGGGGSQVGDIADVGSGSDNNGTADTGGTDVSVGPTAWHMDADIDGFGDPATSLFSDVQPAGWVKDGTDCDDSNGSVYPDAPETENGIDDDCDGQTDEAPLTLVTVDASGVVQATLEVAGPGGLRLRVEKGTRVALETADGDIQTPAASDAITLSVAAKTAGAALPQGVVELTRFSVAVDVNGTQRTTWFSTADDRPGLVAKIPIQAGKVPLGAIAMLYDVSGEKAALVSSAAIRYASEVFTPGAHASGKEDDPGAGAGDGESSLGLPGSGDYSGGGAGGGSGGGTGPGKFWATYEVPDPGCLGLGGGVKVCGPFKVKHIMVGEPSTGDVLGDCFIGDADMVSTGQIPPGYEFWCKRVSFDPATGTTVIEVSSNQSNLPRIVAQLFTVEGNLPTEWTYHTASVLNGPGGASYPDPYQNKEWEYAGIKQLNFYSLKKDINEMRKHTESALQEAGYTASMKFEKQGAWSVGKVDVTDTLDGRYKMEEDVLKDEKWKVRSAETKGNRGGYEDSDQYTGTVKATMTFPMHPESKVWEITANVTFERDSEASTESYAVYKTASGTVTQVIWTVPSAIAGCSGDPQTFEDTYDIKSTDGVMYLTSTGSNNEVEYSAGASMSDMAQVKEKQFQFCCAGMCDPATISSSDQMHEWLNTGKEKQKAAVDGPLQGSYKSDLTDATFEWVLNPSD